MLRIGDFARLAGVTVRALRHYEDEALLFPAQVDARTGYRSYRYEQLAAVDRIVALRDLGFSLAEIRALLRSIVTAPAGNGTVPGIFVVGWLSCDTVEIGPHPAGVERLMADVVRGAGAIVYRVEKPGVGDSEGVCAATGFETELDGYRRAFAAFRQHPRLDPGRIALLGISNGGGFAPLVAEGTAVAAYVTVGGWSSTWFEHMIALERRRVVLAGTPLAQAGPLIKNLDELHAAYLFDRLTPAQVTERRPHLKGVWYDQPEAQYGRPARFYHQLQALDLAAAWGAVRGRALVVWGEYDWIMDRGDQEQIVRLVGPDRAGLLVVPRADHVFTQHASAVAAFQKMGAGSYPEKEAAEIVAFLRGQAN